MHTGTDVTPCICVDTCMSTFTSCIYFDPFTQLCVRAHSTMAVNSRSHNATHRLPKLSHFWYSFLSPAAATY